MLESKPNPKRLIIFLCVITCLLSTAVSFAAEPAEPRKLIVTGSGRIRNNDKATAREVAIKTSLMAAIDVVLVEQLPIGVVVQNFAALSPFTFRNTDTFVLGYRVLSENSHHKQYRVLVEAVIDVNRLKQDLSHLGFAAGHKRLPTILLLISQQQGIDGDLCYWWGNRCKTTTTADSRLAESLRKKGFTIVTPGPLPEALATVLADIPEPAIPEAVALAEHYNASLIIVGLASEVQTTETGSKSTRGVFAAQAVNGNTGAVIAATSHTETSPSANNPKTVSEALMSAVDKAGEDLAKNVIAGLDETKKTTAINMDISGDRLPLNLIKFREVLSALPGVSRVRTQKLRASEASLQINYQQDSRELVHTILQQSFEAFTVEIVEITETSIKLNLILKKRGKTPPRTTDSPG
jgi:hypothetical protein